MKENGDGACIHGRGGGGVVRKEMTAVMETGQQIIPRATPSWLSLCSSTRRAVVALEEKLRCQAGTDSQAP